MSDIREESDDIDDYDDEFDIYEDEMDQGIRTFVHLKWVMDGAQTLSEAAEAVEAYARHMRKLEKFGYQLEAPVDNSHGEVRIQDGFTVPDWMLSRDL